MDSHDTTNTVCTRAANCKSSRVCRTIKEKCRAVPYVKTARSISATQMGPERLHLPVSLLALDSLPVLQTKLLENFKISPQEARTLTTVLINKYNKKYRDLNGEFISIT